MVESLLFPDLTAARGALIPKEVGAVETQGHGAATDAGGAKYGRVAGMPAHGPAFQSADGGWWEMTGREANVRQFGAVGDGLHDDSAAIQAALQCPNLDLILFPAGRYRATGLRLSRPCTLVGHAAELFWDDAEDQRDLLFVETPNFSMSGLMLRGVCYEDFGTRVSPHVLLRLNSQVSDSYGEVRIADVTFIGGGTGCYIGIASNVFISRVRFERCRDYALVLARGPRRVIVDGLIARQIGAYGGVKTGFLHTERATEKVVITNFVIEDCARIEPDPAQWQQGIDLICGYAREWVISNGVISNCGGGGIELKTGGVINDEQEEYADVIVTGVVINVCGNHHGIVLNWTGAKTNTLKRGRRIVLNNNLIRYTNATHTGATGIVVTAWSDVMIANNYVEDATVGIGLAPKGAGDDTMERVSVMGNRCKGVDWGVIAHVGAAANIDISDNVFDCRVGGVGFVGTRAECVIIGNNRIRQLGATAEAIACVYLRNCRDVDVWNNHLNSEGGHAVYVIGERGARSSGRIFKNVVRSLREPFRIAEGRWEVMDNQVRASDDTRTLLVAPLATAHAAWNIRGVRESVSSLKGSAGDVAHAISAFGEGQLGWWFDPGGGGWRSLELAAEAAPPFSPTATPHEEPPMDRKTPVRAFLTALRGKRETN